MPCHLQNMNELSLTRRLFPRAAPDLLAEKCSTGPVFTRLQSRSCSPAEASDPAGLYTFLIRLDGRGRKLGMALKVFVPASSNIPAWYKS